MTEGLGKTVKLFLLWWALLLVPSFIRAILGHFFTNNEILNWTQLLGPILVIIVFFSKHYVELSFGLIERRMVRPVVGMSVLVTGNACSMRFCSKDLGSFLSLFTSGLLALSSADSGKRSPSASHPKTGVRT